MNAGVLGEQKLATPMRVLGVLLVVFSVIEYGVGGAAYSFLISVHVGGWWGGIVTMISAIFALLSNNRCVIITGCIFAVIGIILAVVAAIVDGAQASNINGLTGCFEPTTGDTWGSNSGISDSKLCYFETDDAFNYYGGPGSQCICANSNGDCYGFTLKVGSNCNDLFTKYYDELSASCAMCAILSGLALIYSILTCINCCSPDQAVTPPTSAPITVGPAPGGVMYAPAPVAIPSLQYVQAPPPVVYATTPQVYDPHQAQHPQVIYQQQPQVHQPAYVYQEPMASAPMPVMQTEQVHYEPQQAKWA